MSRKILTVTVIFGFFSVLLPGQEASTEQKKALTLHHEVTVTANRIDTPVKETASAVTVITREDLERTHKSTVLEALQNVLGVLIVQNGPAGASASVLLRGANSEHTLIMLDGVELNDPITPSRSSDLAHLTTASVERIEILRGPQSTLYGSDAMSGVINIITREGQGKPAVTLSTQGGSYGTLASRAEISGSTDRVRYALGTSLFRTEGFSAASTTYEGNQEQDGYANLSFSGRFGLRIAETLNLDLSFRSINTKSDIDNSGGSFGDDPNNTQEYDTLLFRGQLTGLFLGNRWEQKLTASIVDHQRAYENPPDDKHPLDSDRSSFESRIWRVDWQNSLFLHESNTLTFGLEYQQELGESAYHAQGPWGPFSSLFPRQKAHTTGLYVQDRVRVAGRLFGTIGVRLDNHSHFGTSVTFRLAPAYLIEKTQTKLKMTFGTAFKSPSLYQLFAPGTFFGSVGNRDLKPEESSGWDAGFEQAFSQGKILLSFTYFSNVYRNLIDFDYFQGYINIAEAESRGVEVFGQAHLSERVHIQASYTRTAARNKATDEDLIRRPKHKLSVLLSFTPGTKASIDLWLLHVSQAQDLDFSTWPWPVSRAILPAYTLLNASASYEVTQNVQVFGRLENILDQDYEVIKGYGTPGFSAYAGLKIQF